jgi:diguanylate cyclase (GGDEF)-like protein/PAS domain S-box-containing protein
VTRHGPRRVRTAVVRYGRLGFLFGLLFPLGSLLVLVALGRWPAGQALIPGLLQLHLVEPLLYVIDSAPFFLGLFAAFAGTRRDGASRQYRELFDLHPTAMWVFDPSTRRILAVNDAAIRRYRFSREEFRALTIDALCVAAAAEPADLTSGSTPESAALPRSMRHCTKHGETFDVELRGHAMQFAGVPAQLVVAEDVTASRIAEEALKQSEAKFRAIFDHAAIGMGMLDENGYFIEANSAYQKLVGYSFEELQHTRASEMSPPEEAIITRGPVRAIQAGLQQSATVEKHMIRKDGSRILCELTVSGVPRPGGKTGILGMLQDISRRRQLEADFAYRSRHDVLTGLANRAHLVERATKALASAATAPERVAVIFVDLDGFKAINDSLGHEQGNVLLGVIAARLLDATRGSDTVARLDGDEFAVLLQNVDTDEFAAIVARRILQCVALPVVLGDGEIVVTASIGVARGRGGDDAVALIRDADLATYEAKRSGTGRMQLFVPEMHRARSDRLTLESDLRRAVEENQLTIAYQPILHLATGRLVGAEALLRWTHPTRGPIGPAEFVPVAERLGLITELGAWVLHEACRQSAAWTREWGETPSIWSGSAASGDDDAAAFYLSVNASGYQLQDDGIVSTVANALARSSVDPRGLVLEITESVVMHDVEATVSRLHALRKLGIRLAIDDFGTGYSSLGYLQQLPIDLLKIDRSFVRGLGTNGHSASLVRTVLALATMLDVTCVAEGVEEPTQRDFLRTLGCHYAQGFLYSPAVGPAELTRLRLRFAEGCGRALVARPDA